MYLTYKHLKSVQIKINNFIFNPYIYRYVGKTKNRSRRYRR